MKIELVNACDQWLSATLNGLYQGMVVAALAALGLRFAGRTNAATRHAIWLGTLLVVVALLPAQYWRSNLAFDRDAPHGDYAVSTSLREAEPGPGIDPGNPIDKPEAAADSSDPPRFDGAGEASGAKNGEPTPERKTAAGPAPGEQSTSKKSRSGTGLSRDRAFASTLPQGTSLVLMCAWLVGAGVRLSRLGWRLGQLRRLKRSAVAAQNELAALLQELRRKLGVRRNVELKLSGAQRCPVALGFLHPVILLPAHEIQTGEMRDAEPILRHELAHVSRRDDWANLVQQFIQTILFFHPAVWWISKRLGLEREVACDDWVLHQGGRPRAYALLLADMAGRLQTAQPLLAPVVSSNKSQLQQRINMILNTRRNTSPRLAKVRLGLITSATAALALVAVYSWPRLVLAESQTALDARAAGAAAVADDSTVPAAAAVNAVEPDSADAASAAVSAGPDDTSGPKLKSEPNSEDAPPTPPVAPVPPVAPKPATPTLGDLPSISSPRPGRAPGAPRRAGSLEERLARVERMLEKLLAQQQDQPMPRQPGAIGVPKGPEENDAFPWGEKAKRGKEKQKEYAAKESERAAKVEAKQREREEQRRERVARQGEFGSQLEALHQEREALQREVEKLDQKIEHLEHEQERLEQEKGRLEQDQEGHQRDQERGEKQRSGLNRPDAQDRPVTVTVRVANTAPLLVRVPVKLQVPTALTVPVNVTAPVTTTITAPAPS